MNMSSSFSFDSTNTLDSLLLEEPSIFYPSESFKKDANITSYEIYQDANEDRLSYWQEQAKLLDWFSPWDKVLNWQPPYAQWFVGGKINASYNCLDRHVRSGRKNKTALIWEAEDGQTQSYTYEDLLKATSKLANALKALGVKKQDRVAIYMPMIPEAIIAMLSVARIGAIHTVVFGGFSAESLKDRVIDSDAKIIITADGSMRKGSIIPLKALADQVINDCPSVQKVIVVKRTKEPTSMDPTRDVWYHEIVSNVSDECPAEPMDAEDLLFILYTSGTTGKPKGIIHTTGGYMVGATTTTRLVFDCKETDIYWCTADIGWITGHTYVTYGPLSCGLTQFIYEGAPDAPHRGRYWELIEKHKITTLYTAPTAIRTFMKWGEEHINRYNLSSLRLLGSVGEPINPEAWLWYHKNIGSEKCPIVDTWWQTETGSIMVAPIPGLLPLKPGSATRPLPGIEAAILDDAGRESPSGYFALTAPWPSMLRGIYNDPKRYEETYWKKWDGQFYFTADGARQDADGYFWLMGRVDDVINVSGHRLGTMEIESALVDNPNVAEAAVIAISHPIKGQAVAAFISLKEKAQKSQELEDLLKKHVTKKIGAIARPEKILFIYELPKTRSGKIMRRLLRDIAEGKVLGDTTTLSDPSVIHQIKGTYDKEG
jgi:acetyl-CoA synthetase